VTGQATGPFPTLNAFQASAAGPPGNGDAFVTELNPTGSALVYSTFLGGSGSDQGSDRAYAIAVDSVGNAYVTGEAYSSDFPTANAIQSRFGGIGGVGYGDAFVAKFPAFPAAGGPPSISSVVNGASFLPGLVSNSWATIQGSNLSTITDDWTSSIVNGNFPTLLDGVSVTIGSSPAYVNYVSLGQINFLVPPNLPPGPQPVAVKTPNGTSSSFTVTVSTYQPAFFPWPNNQAVATRQDFSLAAAIGTFSGTTTVPAKPGDVVILWGTGFGPTIPAVPPGIPVPSGTTYSTSTLPMVTIDNIPATVYGAALAPGFGGLYQIAIQVPSSLGNGNWPVVATIGGVQSPAGVFLTVQQ
jgi:uncharacterized protein (TIGR03437 family)